MNNPKQWKQKWEEATGDKERFDRVVEKVAEETEDCPNCGVPVGKHMNFCYNCGKVLR